MSIFKRSRKGFKVCRRYYFVNRTITKLLSAFNYGKTVKYEKNKWIKKHKKRGPLAVFDTLDHAISFSPINCVIFKCRYKKSRHEKLWYAYKGNRRKYYKSETQPKNLPDGTRFADKVKLIRRVY